ncbi:putative periplasmic lipoprotein [Aurantiacibacter sediminis]|uniref:Lipoprotein n=1 Tax=Aurantiacibacter sediminis TaxID=2793064 RepID=A0ABS0MZJ3_9SPHN|nr:hypothetical protein [Aurantiacibacter sediminis]MBH5321136.1 hypothetical protein [Aurantiacibacter sediminis]
MRFVFFLILMCLPLAGCSWDRSARIEAGTSQPQFTFTNLGRFIGSNPEPVCATRVSMHQNERIVWEIFVPIESTDEAPKCKTIADIRYGEVPTGFMQSVPPEYLRENTPYELRFDNLGEYPRSGRRAFCLNEDREAVDVRFDSGRPSSCED